MNGLREPCAGRLEILSLLASGALTKAEQEGLEKHLVECAGCRQQLNELQGITASLSSWEDHFKEVEVTSRTQQAWRRNLEGAAAATARDPFVWVTLLWVKLVLPSRRAWSALALVWIGLALFHFAQEKPGEPVLAEGFVPSGKVLAVYLERQRFLDEIVGSPREAAGVEAPQRTLQPRSDRRGRNRLVFA